MPGDTSMVHGASRQVAASPPQRISATAAPGVTTARPAAMGSKQLSFLPPFATKGSEGAPLQLCGNFALLVGLRFSIFVSRPVDPLQHHRHHRYSRVAAGTRPTRVWPWPSLKGSNSSAQGAAGAALGSDSLYHKSPEWARYVAENSLAPLSENCRRFAAKSHLPRSASISEGIGG